MKRKFSLWSVIFVFIGLFLSIQPFSPWSLMYITNWESVIIGFSIFVVGVVFGIKIIIKKEKGLLKYFSLFTIPLGVDFLIFLFAIIGQV